MNISSKLQEELVTYHIISWIIWLDSLNSIHLLWSSYKVLQYYKIQKPFYCQQSHTTFAKVIWKHPWLKPIILLNTDSRREFFHWVLEEFYDHLVHRLPLRECFCIHIFGYLYASILQCNCQDVKIFLRFYSYYYFTITIIMLGRCSSVPDKRKTETIDRYDTSNTD